MNIYDRRIIEMRRLRSMYGPNTEEYALITEAIRKQYVEGNISHPKYNPIGSNRHELPTSTLNPDGKSRFCSCGARHTSFPNHHMNYCDMKEWK